MVSPNIESASPVSSPLVSIVVVNYNGQDHLEECLYALCNDGSSPPGEILVVDNASKDQSLAIIEDFALKHPILKVLKSTVNRGYSGGVNFALKQARGKYIAVLNMDAIVTPGWLVRPISFLELNPNVGAVSPLLVIEGDEQRINAIGQAVHITGLGFNRGLGRSTKQLGEKPIPVSGIHGGAFIIRRDILDRLGGLDESGFLYHEDVDISWLLLLMGYDLYCIPASVVRHKYFLSMYHEKLYLLERNRCAMLFAYLESTGLLLLSPWLICTEAMMWGYCLLRGAKFLKAKAASYRWVINQRQLLKERKTFVRAMRKRSDWQVFVRLAWSYAWDQFITLGKERAPSHRQPPGGLQVRIG